MPGPRRIIGEQPPAGISVSRQALPGYAARNKTALIAVTAFDRKIASRPE
jgi:hypothetical protein